MANADIPATATSGRDSSRKVLRVHMVQRIAQLSIVPVTSDSALRASGRVYSLHCCLLPDTGKWAICFVEIFCYLLAMRGLPLATLKSCKL